MADYGFILLIIKAVIGVMVVIAVTTYVLRPLLKNLSGVDDRMSPPRPDLNRRLQEEELEIPTSQPTDISKQAIIKKALEDPMKTTQLVRNWLREKK